VGKGDEEGGGWLLCTSCHEVQGDEERAGKDDCGWFGDVGWCQQCGLLDQAVRCWSKPSTGMSRGKNCEGSPGQPCTIYT
jgi:hypothetical protein